MIFHFKSLTKSLNLLKVHYFRLNLPLSVASNLYFHFIPQTLAYIIYHGSVITYHFPEYIQNIEPLFEISFLLTLSIGLISPPFFKSKGIQYYSYVQSTLPPCTISGSAEERNVSIAIKILVFLFQDTLQKINT